MAKCVHCVNRAIVEDLYGNWLCLFHFKQHVLHVKKDNEQGNILNLHNNKQILELAMASMVKGG